LAVLSLSTFVFVTAESLPIGLLQPIATGLQVPQASVGLLVTGYAGVVVVATIPLTRATRRVPRKVLMVVLLGVFVTGTVLCAVSASYLALLLSRLVIAFAQALFWAVVSPAAAAVVKEEAQGKAVALVNAGSALGPVLGVPAGTWIGQLAGWRSAFLVLAAVGVVVLIGLLAALPSKEATAGHAEVGVQPDRVRFMVTVLATGLAVTGAYAAFTYVTPFLNSVTRLSSSSDGGLLLLRGIAGFAGAIVIGLTIDRAPWVSVFAVVVLQAVAFAAQWVFGIIPPLAIAAVVTAGFTLSALASANGARILRYAPGDTAAASAAVSTAFNVGIMLGALAGSITETTLGLATVPLIGAVISVAAVGISAAEPPMVRARERAATPSSSATSAVRPR
jgi:predicted MFS family arabinose efflux permease